MDYPIQNQSKRSPAAQTLSYAQSLRAIGQALEAFRLKSFELHKNGTDYILHVGISASAGKLKTITAKLSVRADHFKIPITSSDIDRLDAEGRSRRGSASGRPTADLSLSLRVVGDFLDEKRAVTFSISWSPHLVMVQYQTPNGNHRVRDFTTENLYDRAVHKLGVQMYLRRS
jgi:hypothetical protein